MARWNRREYRICASYDTETTNINRGEGSNAIHTAFVSLYIFADLRDVDLYTYEQGDETVHFYRTEDRAIEFIQQMIEYGKENKIVPIICAYNLMFDMQTLMQTLNVLYDMKVSAQSSTNVYTLDLYEDDVQVLRFWDTFHLEMRGLAAMGETCGLPKANGDWDYTLVRTPKTRLTGKEKYYATRDVQVIPAYLRYLLHANAWLTPKMLGCNVLTKTSLVRQMAKHDIGKIKNENGNVGGNFYLLCKQEMPRDYETYALRKACFLGAITFTSANNANQVWHNVASLDVTSMHHTYINGRYVPVKFERRESNLLADMVRDVFDTPMSKVLKTYHRPFYCAFHIKIRFTNIHIKPNTVFSKDGIGIIPQAKFRKFMQLDPEDPEPAKVEAYNKVVENGYGNTAINPTFAYGKMMEADECVLHITEVEAWNINQVYEFDTWEVLEGEGTTHFVAPPDYVTLQSNMLFKMKSEVKNLTKTYHEGTPYTGEISDLIPDGIVMSLKDGTLTEEFLEGYYTSTCKGMFNSIYGTMAQDVYKPDFVVKDGQIQIDRDTITTQENWDESQPESCKVLYTYGMRIVGGSRMHLVISMMLMDEYFGDRVHMTGGDTDSIKCACDEDVTDEELLQALQPIYDASTNGINESQKRVRKCFPDLASDLYGIGGFEVEGTGSGTRYKSHIEYWNKARLSIDYNGKPHVTFAGLSRHENMYNINDALSDLLKEYSEEEVLEYVLGYNVTVDNSICHASEITLPAPEDMFDADVTDYNGDTTHVTAHEAKCIYPASRMLGDTMKYTNRCNVTYNDWIYREERTLKLDEGRVTLWKGKESQSSILLSATTHTSKSL